MKKRSGDIPENGLNDVVILLHSEGNLKKKGFGDILEKSLNDALIHLRKVLNGEITERNYKPPPKTIQRLIAEEVFRELSDVDFDAVGNLHREIRRVESKMWDPAKQIVLAIKERGKHKKNKHLELARIYIQQLDSHIVFHHEELENYKDYYQRLVKTLNETEAEIEKEIHSALKRAIKTLRKTVSWEMCVIELKPGPKVKSSEHNRVMRDVAIINGYEKELAKDPGPCGPDQIKRVILKMEKKLKAAGKKRTGYQTIKNSLKACGIN